MVSAFNANYLFLQMAVCLVFAVVIIQILPCGAPLPKYMPNINNPTTQTERDSIIEDYFHLGFSYKEIVLFLLCRHGIKLSLRHVKRLLRSRELRRRKNYDSLPDVIDVIIKELQGSGSSIGYRLMHQRLRLNHSITIDRETVRKLMKGLDPEGVECRSKRKFQRRKYHSMGPNFIWHLDGYDKLKPFGFCIHGCIDGFSRRILWLEVGLSNNNPRVIVQYFIDCIRQTGGVPCVVRGDCGSENVYIAGVQRYLRKDDNDHFSGGKSFLYGKSIANQRIEAWWSILRKSNTSWWINYFKDMRDSGEFNANDPLEQNCLQFCFMQIIQNELHQVAKNWNLHNIRPSTNQESPSGKPDIMYFLPERYSTTDYKKDVDWIDLDIAESTCGEQNPPMGCHPSFAELATMIMQENNLSEPEDASEAKELYNQLLLYIRDI